MPERCGFCCRSHAYELTDLLERIVEALTPSDPAIAASVARSQLLSLHELLPHQEMLRRKLLVPYNRTMPRHVNLREQKALYGFVLDRK